MSYADSKIGPSGRGSRPGDLTVSWSNVGRRSDCHDASLSLAFDEQIDVVCVQEPWTGNGLKTKSHSGYHKYAPVDT